MGCSLGTPHWWWSLAASCSAGRLLDLAGALSFLGKPQCFVSVPPMCSFSPLEHLQQKGFNAAEQCRLSLSSPNGNEMGFSQLERAAWGSSVTAWSSASLCPAAAPAPVLSPDPLHETLLQDPIAHSFPLLFPVLIAAPCLMPSTA